MTTNDDDCMFCSIANKDVEADIVFEDNTVVAFRDINPQAPVHILIIPRKHIASVNEMESDDEALVGKLSFTAKKIAAEEGFDKTGFRLVMNCGEDANQTVEHMHLHCLAGREMDWPPG